MAYLSMSKRHLENTALGINGHESVLYHISQAIRTAPNSNFLFVPISNLKFFLNAVFSEISNWINRVSIINKKQNKNKTQQIKNP